MIDRIGCRATATGRQVLLGVLLAVVPAIVPAAVHAATQTQVAEYVRDNILGGSYGDVTLWMTQEPFLDDHVARDPDPAVTDAPFPNSSTWLVMIDDAPRQNFGHPVRWVFVDDDLGSHVVLSEPKQFPPRVFASFGFGLEEAFACVPVTPAPCPSTSSPAAVPVVPAPEKPCLHAVLIDGAVGVQNYGRYKTNLRSMYKKLRERGYPGATISTYHSDGEPLDLDNADNDANDATGNDVTGAAKAEPIRNKIRALCETLTSPKDVLLIYATNHGAQNQGLVLAGENGKHEYYTPDQLAQDTQDCKVCRVFVIMDQCYSGQFTGVPTDGQHANMALYTAASATQPSVCRQYMAYWEKLDLLTNTANQLHASVTASMAPQQKGCYGGARDCEPCTDNTQCPGGECKNDGTSTPQSAQGSPGRGDAGVAQCCPDHFQCYELKRKTFAGERVDLVDQFGSVEGALVEKPDRVCAPASKKDEDPTAPLHPDHLTAYNIRYEFDRVLAQRVVNQFGETMVDVVRPDRLLVPSAKRLVPPAPAAPVAPAVDHFQCYKVRRTRGTTPFRRIEGVKVQDQLGTVLLDVVKPLRLCAPVDKNDESPGAETRPDHLLCYRTRPSTRFGQVTVELGDQFGSLTRLALRRQELCVPSLKNPLPTTTSTTATSTSTTTTVTVPATCAAAGIATPPELPDQTTCNAMGTVNCNDWEPIGPEFPAAEVIGQDDGTVQLYRRIDGTTTCFYLYRVLSTHTANGVHCYNTSTCDVCAWDFKGTTPRWADLKFASAAGVEDCSECHAAGPVAPTRPFWNASQSRMRDIMMVCAARGGPRWIGAPPAWTQDSPTRKITSPESCAGPTCHATGFVKDAAQFCDQMVRWAFAVGGSMRTRSFANATECFNFAMAMGCDPSLFNCLGP